MSQSQQSQRTTKVIVEETVRFGTFANAFRVVEEAGPDCYLDFMVYSASEQQATVVARVRVRRDFIPAIRDNLGTALTEFREEEGDSTVAGSIVFRKTSDPLH
jgi:hypothetical protein